jgi:16S rRNA processing protein RimM
MHDFLTIGQVANTHGLRGELKVLPLTDDPKRYNRLKKIFIEHHGSSKKISEFEIEGIKYFKNFVILKLVGLDKIEDAVLLKRSTILIDKSEAVTPPKDSYFLFDLIGLKVYDEDKAFLGDITDVIQTGSNDCYNVKKEDGSEFFIPALKTVVLNVDIDAKEMIVKLPKGLID